MTTYCEAAKALLAIEESSPGVPIGALSKHLKTLRDYLDEQPSQMVARGEFAVPELHPYPAVVVDDTRTIAAMDKLLSGVPSPRCVVMPVNEPLLFVFDEYFIDEKVPRA